jgi:hypothetical protein
MNERRHENRLEVCLDAQWEGSRHLPARITDLSEGGCFVDTTGEAYIGERLTFRVQMPNGNWLDLTGEVAHQLRTVGFGLRFVDLTNEQLEQLRAFIEHLKDPHAPITAVLR